MARNMTTCGSRASWASWGYRAVAAAVLCGAAALAASAAQPDPSARVAIWNGGDVTVEEFITYYGYTSETERQPLPTLEAKIRFLDPLINAEMMMQEAESLGIPNLPTVADFVRGRRAGTLTEMVQVRATQGRIKVAERDVEAIYNKTLTEMEIKEITTRTREEADAMLDSIKAGVPFEDLARRYSTSPTGERGGELGKIRWGDFKELWSAHAYDLEPGEVSDVFQLEGIYFILKSYSKQVVPPPDSLEKKAGIRRNLERDLAFKERGAYLDSLRMAYNYYVDEDAVIHLATKYAIAIARLGEPTAVVDGDITPQVTDAERAVPLVTMRGKQLTTGAMIDIIARTPFQVRPAVDDPDQFIPFVVMRANDSLLVAEAENLGLDKDPSVIAAVSKARRRKTLYAFYEFVSRDAQVSEEEARAFYEANAQAYRMSEGYTISKIVVGTREAADSVLVRLAGGEAFEDIARVRSRDPFTAPQGGYVGFVRPEDDPEFAGFLGTMQVGEKKAFRSLEGFVILWYREYHSPRPATFEEARAAVEKELLPGKRDEAVEKWVADKRAAAGIVINEDVLDQIVLPT
jgi:peptidyl-prolyl cis-trans isomerase C